MWLTRQIAFEPLPASVLFGLSLSLIILCLERGLELPPWLPKRE
jgi:hypothetical protein